MEGSDRGGQIKNYRSERKKEKKEQTAQVLYGGLSKSRASYIHSFIGGPNQMGCFRFHEKIVTKIRIHG